MLQLFSKYMLDWVEFWCMYISAALACSYPILYSITILALIQLDGGKSALMCSLHFMYFVLMHEYVGTAQMEVRRQPAASLHHVGPTGPGIWCRGLNQQTLS